MTGAVVPWITVRREMDRRSALIAAGMTPHPGSLTEIVARIEEWRVDATDAPAADSLDGAIAAFLDTSPPAARITGTAVVVGAVRSAGELLPSLRVLVELRGWAEIFRPAWLGEQDARALAAREARAARRAVGLPAVERCACEAGAPRCADCTR